MDADKRVYHTYTLLEEKMTHVVIKGVAKDIESQEFLESEHGIQAAAVHHLKSHWGKQPLNMMLVKLPNKEDSKKIMGVKEYNDLGVKVEDARR